MEETETTRFDGDIDSSTAIVNTTFSTTGLEFSISWQDTVHIDSGARVITAYSPPRNDKRFTLSPGGSINLAATATRTDWTLDERIAVAYGETGGRSQTGTLNMTVTYVGQEAVVVPGGTYQACRFEETTESASATVWYAKQTGEIVKQAMSVGGARTVLELTHGDIGVHP